MTERGVVAGPRRVEDNVTAQRSKKLIRLEIEDPGADLDCFDVRDRARGVNDGSMGQKQACDPPGAMLWARSN